MDIRDPLNINSNDFEEDNINFANLFNTLLRSKKIIFSFSFLITLSTFIISFLQKPTYKGSFQIVADKNSDKDSLLSPTNLALDNLLLGNNSNQKTQEYILKSSSILNPIFKFSKQEYIKRGEDKQKLTYQNWLSSYVDIAFLKGSKVLTFSFIDQDKSLIKKVLNLTLKEYQEYSRRDRIKTITNGIDYLKKQEKKLLENSKKSSNKLNKFSIENRLGNFELTSIINNKKNNKEEDKDGENIKNSKFEFGQRFKPLFILLETKETQYRNYSAYLKPNSQILQELKIEIDNLKKFLKRPNEILIEYKELEKQAYQDEFLLAKIQKELKLYNLELARKQDPWEVINKPVVFNTKVFPKTEKNTFIAFIISLFAVSVFAIFKENNSGIIFEKDKFKKIINCKYLDTIHKNEEGISNMLIDFTIKKELNIDKLKDDQKIGIIDISKKFETSENIMNNYKNYIYIDIKEPEKINELLGLFVILRPGINTVIEISMLKKYLKLYDKKVIGWFYFQ
tara:strand:- start:5112 stop:6641 length:1530 start_codon:yes stop_codon:yes gene_type:complete